MIDYVQIFVLSNTVHHYTAPANDLVEASNRSLRILLKKVVGKSNEIRTANSRSSLGI